MEKIKLEQYVVAVLKMKWRILVFTLACALVSAAVSVFIIKPQYEAKSSMLVSPINIVSGIDPKTSVIFSGDTNSLHSMEKYDNKMLGVIINNIKYPNYGVDSMVYFMQGDSYKKEALKDYYKKYDQLKISYDGETNIISLDVLGSDADAVLQANNLMFEYLPVFLSQVLDTQYNNLKKDIDSNIKKEKKKIEERGNVSEQDSNYILAHQALYAYDLVSKEVETLENKRVEDLVNIQEVSIDESAKKVNPDIKKNLAVSVLFGFVISVLFVLFMEIGKRTNIES